jgi:hypothetical protein
MAVEKLTIVFKHATLDVKFALDAIQRVFAERHLPSTGFELYGAPVDLTEVWPRLEKTRRKTFNMAGRGFIFHLGSVANFQLDFLVIKAAGETYSAWNKWAARFICNPNFVMAWLADAEYEHWQNADDLLEYTAAGRTHEHLPKVSNGLPPPLEQTVVDISTNPGRRFLRSGYYEVVSSVMWLGEPFWQLGKANKRELEQLDWLEVSNPLTSVVRIEASPKCFATDRGVAGEIQRRLRTLLFHK